MSKEFNKKWPFYIGIGLLALTLIFLIISFFAAQTPMMALAIVFTFGAGVLFVIGLKHCHSKLIPGIAIGTIALTVIILIVGIFVATLVMKIIGIVLTVAAMICAIIRVAKYA